MPFGEIVDGRTVGLTDGWTDDVQISITIAQLELFGLRLA